jgi:DNA (cytosine-5)-methyltransferase 1
LVRLALENEGFEVVFANDIEPSKGAMYAANFDASHFVLDDVRRVRGADVPCVDLATASFPCTDLSLAGCRAGLGGTQSGMFWEFARVLEEMGGRRPRAVLLENVVGFATSKERLIFSFPPCRETKRFADSATRCACRSCRG